jgi:uncharacterized membrane protein YdjX (TVP38/TMEM64 family)
MPATPDQPDADHSFAAIVRRLGPASALAALWAVLPAVAGFTLIAQIGPVSAWLREVGPWVYGIAFALGCGIGVLPTYAQAIVGGWAFGVGRGLPAALVAVTVGATIGFLLARSVSRRRAERLIQEDPRAVAIRDTLIGRGPLRTVGVITLLRLPPNSPFALTNLALAAAGAPLWGVIVGTALGLAPRTAAAVYIASRIEGELTTDVAKEAVKTGGWTGVAISIVVTLIVLIVIGVLAKRALARVHQSA